MKRTILLSSVFAAFAALPVIAACGGSGGVNSGVDDTKTGSSVTGDEAKQICNAVFDYMEAKSSTPSCAGAAYYAIALAAGSSPIEIPDATLQQTCVAARSACETTPPPSGSGGGTATDPCANVTAAPPGCNSTVGNFETCVTEQIDLQADLMGSPEACESVTNASIKARVAPSSVCAGVRDNCAVGLASFGIVVPAGGDSGTGGTGSGGTGSGGAGTGGAATGGAGTGGAGTGGSDTGADSCTFAGDGECDEPTICEPGTDTTDCAAAN